MGASPERAAPHGSRARQAGHVGAVSQIQTRGKISRQAW